jgi:hypothetical protein
MSLGMGIGAARWISYSPFFGHPIESRRGWLDREVDVIERALREHGELDRRTLAERIGARRWGPRRFRQALREAVASGAARRIGRDSYTTPRTAG